MLLSVEFWITLKTYLKGAPFYNASASEKFGFAIHIAGVGVDTDAARDAVALLCALPVQIGACCHNSIQLTATRILNIRKEMQGKCLSGLDLGFWVEMSC